MNKKNFFYKNNIYFLYLASVLTLSYPLSLQGMQLVEAEVCTIKEKIDSPNDKEEVLSLKKCIAGERCIIYEATQEPNKTPKHFVFTLETMNALAQNGRSQNIYTIEDSNSNHTYTVNFDLSQQNITIISDAYKQQPKDYFRKNIKQICAEISKINDLYRLNFEQSTTINNQSTEVTLQIPIDNSAEANLTQLISKIKIDANSTLLDQDQHIALFTFQQNEQSPVQVMNLVVNQGVQQLFPQKSQQQNIPCNVINNNKTETSKKVQKAFEKAVDILNASPQTITYENAKVAKDQLAQQAKKYNVYKEATKIHQKLDKKRKKIGDKITDLSNQLIPAHEIKEEKEKQNNVILNNKIEELRILQQDIAQKQQNIRRQKINKYNPLQISQMKQNCKNYKDAAITIDCVEQLEKHIMHIIHTLSPDFDFSSLDPRKKTDMVREILCNNPSEDIRQFYKKLQTAVHPDKNKGHFSNIYTSAIKNIEADLATAVPFYKSIKKNKKNSELKKTSERWEFFSSNAQAILLPTIIHEIGSFFGPTLAYHFSNKEQKKYIAQLKQSIESDKAEEKDLLLSSYNQLNQCVPKKTTDRDFSRLSKILEDN